jgi:hypothetical protein
VIGLAVGKKAVASSPDTGTVYGEEVAHSCFRDDLAWTSKLHGALICFLRWLT